MTLLTHEEAEELIVDHLMGTGERINATTYEGGVYDLDMTEARTDIDAFISTLGREIDPLSIKIKPDRLDEMDIPCVAITIKIGERT